MKPSKREINLHNSNINVNEVVESHIKAVLLDSGAELAKTGQIINPEIIGTLTSYPEGTSKEAIEQLGAVHKNSLTQIANSNVKITAALATSDSILAGRIENAKVVGSQSSIMPEPISEACITQNIPSSDHFSYKRILEQTSQQEDLPPSKFLKDNDACSYIINASVVSGGQNVFNNSIFNVNALQNNIDLSSSKANSNNEIDLFIEEYKNSDLPDTTILKSKKEDWLKVIKGTVISFNYRKDPTIYFEFNERDYHKLDKAWKGVWHENFEIKILAIQLFYNNRLWNEFEIAKINRYSILAMPLSPLKLLVPPLENKFVDIFCHHLGGCNYLNIGITNKFQLLASSKFDMEKVKEIIIEKDIEKLKLLIAAAEKLQDTQWQNYIFLHTGAIEVFGVNLQHMNDTYFNFEYGNIINICAFNRFYEGLILLLENYSTIDVNRYNYNIGWTPLLSAIVDQNLLAVKCLLKAGANPNLPNNGAVRYKYKGFTPLQSAISYAICPTKDKIDESFEILKVLLLNGADPNLSLEDSPAYAESLKYALECASPYKPIKENPNLEKIILLLLEFGAKTENLDEEDKVFIREISDKQNLNFLNAKLKH